MDSINELLTRGVDTIYPSKEELEKILRSGKKLKLYQGFDPTGTQLHIGHMIGLMKLRDWQKLGHHVIFLIGDATGIIGDPSGKTAARKLLGHDEVLKNAETYKEQASKILSFNGNNPVEIKFNGEWLNKLSHAEFMYVTSLVSYNQIIERDMFQERLKKNESIGAIELLYPILQGYDSVAMNVDLEIGGTDQMFNMIMGRDLLKKLKDKEKFIMTTPLLTDSEGRKIGKTEGNVIGITDNPNDLFGKLMALPDSIIGKGFEYLTRIPMEEVKQIKEAMQAGENPVIYKKHLAFEIVKQLHNEQSAKEAQEYFERTVQKKELPEEMPRITLPNDTLISYADLLVQTGLASSKSDAKRLIEQGGVEVDNERIIEPGKEIVINDTIIVKVGKRRFIEIVAE